MLAYLGSGTRDYARKPIAVYARQFWEFQAVLEGAIAPVFGSDRRSEYCTRCMWIFPPGLAHGWSGRQGEPCEVAVFHFDGVAEPAASFLRKRGWVRADLDDSALGRVREVSQTLMGLRGSNDPLAGLRFDRGAIELVIMALESLPPRETAALAQRETYIVESAVAWFAEHLSEGPDTAAVARAVNCSASHLRRLFLAVRGAPPSRVLDDLRILRAKEMLAGSALSIKEIAWACGFGSQSCFSRAFVRHAGRSPRRWREANGAHQTAAQKFTVNVH